MDVAVIPEVCCMHCLSVTKNTLLPRETTCRNVYRRVHDAPVPQIAPPVPAVISV